ncbi:hypothetical protein KCP73_00600 [Salmonella enterica subsp. enterica]|nr:hypothetical protein KCP73_00600 [Salmonella enterica subsp. enterica]
MVWRRRLKTGQYDLLLAGISGKRHSKMRRVFTRRQWLNGRFRGRSQSRAMAGPISMDQYFARVLLKRCEGKGTVFI